MREQLIQYVNLLFAGAADSEEIKQEILQNTLDRFDDLVTQGKAPEAAYRLAISGIGDIEEILQRVPETSNETDINKTESDNWQIPFHADKPKDRQTTSTARAVAIGMYIFSPAPAIIFSGFNQENLGIFFMFLLIAAATVLLIMNKPVTASEKAHAAKETSPKQELRKAIGALIGPIGLVCYLVVSYFTGAWYITWIIFPMIGCVQGIINAIIDLKEVNNNED